MRDSEEGPTPPDELPEPLISHIDSLESSGLKAVSSYVEQRIESLRTPIEEEIEATASGEVIDIDHHGPYTLVRKHPPDPDGPGANTNLVSLYQVRREQHLDGTESLHWTYLGDVSNPDQIRCNSCGRTFDVGDVVCPHCGSEEAHHSNGEE